ncbi:hypothetical protein PHMEG_0008513 [Phytophthora megakarya]|uniref:Uncharacterized protein n=1 Tax=Phytophthora megakarya TaxID=4795 RepID=A0A225WKM0_9STRA|nr:hypothetical protein PHMEG_0008513 [Phytophthora megakarya]
MLRMHKGNLGQVMPSTDHHQPKPLSVHTSQRMHFQRCKVKRFVARALLELIRQQAITGLNMRKINTNPPTFVGDIDGIKLNSIFFQFESYFRQKGYGLIHHDDELVVQLGPRVVQAQGLHETREMKRLESATCTVTAKEVRSNTTGPLLRQAVMIEHENAFHYGQILETMGHELTVQLLDGSVIRRSSRWSKLTTPFSIAYEASVMRKDRTISRSFSPTSLQLHRTRTRSEMSPGLTLSLVIQQYFHYNTLWIMHSLLTGVWSRFPHPSGHPSLDHRTKASKAPRTPMDNTAVRHITTDLDDDDASIRAEPFISSQQNTMFSRMRSAQNVVTRSKHGFVPSETQNRIHKLSVGSKHQGYLEALINSRFVLLKPYPSVMGRAFAIEFGMRGLSFMHFAPFNSLNDKAVRIMTSGVNMQNFSSTVALPKPSLAFSSTANAMGTARSSFGCLGLHTTLKLHSPSGTLNTTTKSTLSAFVGEHQLGLAETMRIYRNENSQDTRSNKALDPSRLKVLLEGYPHLSVLLDVARHGISPTSCPPNNYLCFTRHQMVAIRSISTGQASGHFLVVDASIMDMWPNVHCSPFGLVEKSDVDPRLDVRLIHDLSFSNGSSTNGLLDKACLPEVGYGYVTVLAARIEDVASRYPQSSINVLKGDVKGAYRHLMTNANHVHQMTGLLRSLDALIIDIATPFG